MLVVNVFVAFWFNNLVLDGDFAWLGWNWITAQNGKIDYESLFRDISDEKMNKEEVLYRTFPRRAECSVNWYGSSGDLQKTNYYCILGPNSLAQYLFLFLWFWYALLLIINVLNLMRIILMILRVGIIRNVYLMSAVGTAKVLINLMLPTIS